MGDNIPSTSRRSSRRKYDKTKLPTPPPDPNEKDDFLAYLDSLQKSSVVYSRSTSTFAPVIATEDAFDHLEKLYKLMEQMLELREQNAKLHRRVRDLEHINNLERMQKEMDVHVQDDCPELDKDTAFAETILESILSATKTPKHKFSPSSKLRQSISRRNRARSGSVANIRLLEPPSGLKSDQRRASASADVDSRLKKSAKVSKWTKVKAAFKWEKASPTVSDAKSQDSGIGGIVVPVEVARYLRVPSCDEHGHSPVDSGAAEVYTPGTLSTASSTEDFHRHVPSNIQMEFLKTPSFSLSEEENYEFLSFLPSIVEDLTNNKDFENILGLEDHVKKLLNSVLPNGKKNRFTTFLATYKMLQKKENITPENKKHSYVLAWIGEIYFRFLEIMDDIVDRSTTRRNRPCWNTINNRHLESINDALFLEQAANFLLKKYFSEHKHYLAIQDIWRDFVFKVSIGQIMDCLCKENGQVNWAYFTMENYTKIVFYKSNCFAPTATAAMYLADVTDTNLLHDKNLKTLLTTMSQLCQVQNDFWDCYTEKSGTDIREGKCTWLAVTAWEKANPEQKQLMETFYGQNTAEAEKRIHELYEELDLKKCYAKYKEESLKKICDTIEKVPEGFSHRILYKLADMIYKYSFTFF